MNDKPILVPVDLTATSHVAMGHACHIAEKVNAPVHVLHLVKTGFDIAEGEERLDAFMEKVVDELEPKVKIEATVKPGNILEDIGIEAEKTHAMLVIIGTHGLQGFEHIVGTHAMRIVKTAAVPFIVVQEKHVKPSGYDNIIVPIEMEKEGKQKLELVANFAGLFDATVHLVVPYENDEFLRNTQTRNLNFSKRYLKDRNVKSVVTELDEHEKDFSEATVKAAIKDDGDLIAVVNLHEMSMMGFFGSETQDVLINKAMIPVLVVNPRMMINDDMFGIFTQGGW